MANAKIKTTVNDASVEEFLNKVDDTQRREDGFKVLEMMKEVTGEKPKMWGPAIIGFGQYHYKYESGREGDMPKVGFSPRKQNLSLYVGISDPECQKLFPKLGKHTTSKACLYIKKLSDVDGGVLREIIDATYKGPAPYES